MDPDGIRPWAFTWSGLHVSWIREREGLIQYGIVKFKKLSKVWKTRRLRAIGYSRHTTLIADNTPAICRCNYGNAIYIDTYGGGLIGEDDPVDDSLLVLIAYLKELSVLHRDGNSVRHVEKRGWYSRT